MIQKHPFTMFQMFRSKQETLEKKIAIYYQASKDMDTVIKLVRLMQIRDVLGKEEIEKPCLELVRFLYMKQATNTLKRYFFYFRSYFSRTEWAYLVWRLFSELPIFRAWQILQTVHHISQMTAHIYTIP